MHLCRLLIQGTESLKTGTLQVNVGTYKERLLSIRHEQMSMEIFKIWHSELEEKFNEAKLVTKLPDEPDPKPAEDFLRQMRLLMLFPWEPDNDLLSS
jgi:hypothetical protein